MTRAAVAIAFLVGALALPQMAHADELVIGRYSQQNGLDHAEAGASIDVVYEQPEQPGAQEPDVGGDETEGKAPIGGASDDLPPIPTLASDDPRLDDPEPYGPGTFWYTDADGLVCTYEPDTVGVCYVLTSPESGAASIDPAGIAASVADRLDLTPGRIVASPQASVAGITGMESWFWLEPAPQASELTVSLGGQTVLVRAEPLVEWSFGDGTTLIGGPGVAYQDGEALERSIRHVYETRCLPGDQGRNPHVLTSCEEDGYRVASTVIWRITYQASGPIDETGSLPARSTETAIAYPVSEVRAFLVSGATKG